MKKRNYFFDTRKEEEWLNSIEGYKLTKVGLFTYEFEESKKNFEYQVVYSNGKMGYLRILNNLKNNVTEIKHKGIWVYFRKEKNNQSFYRRPKEYEDELMQFINKYTLYSRSFLMFGIASLITGFYIHYLLFIISAIFLLLSFLYRLCIKSTKDRLNVK